MVECIKLIFCASGGINSNTIRLVPKLDIAVSGSFVCMSDDFQLRIEELLKK